MFVVSSSFVMLEMPLILLCFINWMLSVICLLSNKKIMRQLWIVYFKRLTYLAVMCCCWSCFTTSCFRMCLKANVKMPNVHLNQKRSFWSSLWSINRFLLKEIPVPCYHYPAIQSFANIQYLVGCLKFIIFLALKVPRSKFFCEKYYIIFLVIKSCLGCWFMCYGGKFLWFGFYQNPDYYVFNEDQIGLVQSW